MEKRWRSRLGYARMALRRSLRRLGAAVAVTAAWSCGSEAGKESNAAAVREGRPAASSVETAVLPGGCELIPREEVERLAGPIEGQPEREGTGCWYYFPFDSSAPEWARLREWERQVRASAPDTNDIAPRFEPRRPGLFVGVDVSGSAMLSTRAVAAATEVMERELEAKSPKARPPAGWDQAGRPLARPGFSGRVGHLTVTIALQGLRLAPDTVAALAARVRDRIPDRPFAHPAADPSASPPVGKDPCSVLTAAEAEAVLGPLAAPPFRTRDGSPLADPTGKSCAYYTAGHRVLVLTPEWEYGRLTLSTERMGSNLVEQVAALSDIVADTMEGPWDDAIIGLAGDLVLVKGKRSLSVAYLMSSTDVAGAVRLAGPALARLAAAEEPAHPEVPAGGCLPPAVVGEIVGEPVRLMGSVMGTYGSCHYQLDLDPTASIELTIQPAGRAAETFASLQSTAKIRMGKPAERVDLGEEGWAYGSGSGAEAAAKSAGKVYHARIRIPLSTTASSRKDAMVGLVGRLID